MDTEFIWGLLSYLYSVYVLCSFEVFPRNAVQEITCETHIQLYNVMECPPLKPVILEGHFGEILPLEIMCGNYIQCTKR